MRKAISEWYQRKEGEKLPTTVLREVKVGDNLLMQVVVTQAPNGRDRLLFLRQDSVIIIPVIEHRGKIYTILGNEYRSGAAEEFLGFPAGSLEKPEKTLLEMAKDELCEETPIQREWITQVREINTGEKNYVSPGGTNEQIFYVRADITLPDEVDDIEKVLGGKVCGSVEESESITSVIVELRKNLIFKLPIEGNKLALSLLLDQDPELASRILEESS